MPDSSAQQAALDRKPDLQIVGRHHHRRSGPGRRRVGLRLRREQRSGIGMFRRGENLLHRSLLDDLAAIHDADHVRDAANDAEIVGDEQHAHAEPRADFRQQGQDLRLHCDVERRGRLVRDQQIGLVRQCHPDHDPLALAAGQLMRIAGKPCFRFRNADLCQQLDGPRPRPLAANSAVKLQDLADLGLDRMQRLERGHRLLEDDRNVVATNAANLALRQLQQFAPLELHASRGMRCGRVRQELQDRQRADGFSGARLSDQRHALAAPDLERNMIDRNRSAARLMKRHREIADVEQWLVDGVHAGYLNVLRGSKASRTASPMKISNDSMMATAKKPVKPSQGAWTLALPCDSNSPSEGEPGGNPKPRKSSAVSVITDDETMKGRNVMVATMALGNRCRNMILALDTPSARAAMMYSKLRPRRNSARTRPTKETHENNRRMPSRTKKPGTSTDDRINNRYSEGIAVQTSMNRWKARSIQPPKYPCTPPAATPMIDEMMVRLSPNSTEMRNP